MERTLCLTFTEIHQQDYLPVHVLDDTSKFCAGGTVGEDTCNVLKLLDRCIYNLK